MSISLLVDDRRVQFSFANNRAPIKDQRWVVVDEIHVQRCDIISAKEVVAAEGDMPGTGHTLILDDDTADDAGRIQAKGQLGENVGCRGICLLENGANPLGCRSTLDRDGSSSLEGQADRLIQNANKRGARIDDDNTLSAGLQWRNKRLDVGTS